MAPTTLSARWTVANTQSSIPLLARAINNLGGIGTGRRAVQIRPFKLPSTSSSSSSSSSSNNNNTKSKLENNNNVNNKTSSKEEGRNMFVVRSLGPSEKTVIFIEDLTAITRKEKESLPLSSPSTVPHTRWTHTVLESFTSSQLQQSNTNPVPFDAFLSRVLLGGGSGANVVTTGNWLSRSTAISIEGFIFSIMGDWEIRIGSVSVKGAASGGSTRGVFVEATYLAVPYLPTGSTLVKDFLTTLFPPPAIASGEIEWITISDEDLFEAGLISKVDLERGGEWEWSDEHSFLAYIKMLRLEGIL